MALIVNAIESASAHMERVASEVSRARGLLDRLEKATLAKAFRGELLPSGSTSSDGAASEGLVDRAG